jgi:hypothetical protein
MAVTAFLIAFFAAFTGAVFFLATGAAFLIAFLAAVFAAFTGAAFFFATGAAFFATFLARFFCDFFCHNLFLWKNFLMKNMNEV